MYNNNNNFGGFGNGPSFSRMQGGYAQNSFRNYPNQRSHYNAVQAVKKHSGAQLRLNHTTKSGVLKAAVMWGWNYSRTRGMVKFVAVPAKDTTVNNKSGKDLSKWVAKISFSNGQSQTMTCFMNRATHKLTFPDLGMVANASAPNGGYWGAAFRRKNNR